MLTSDPVVADLLYVLFWVIPMWLIGRKLR